MYKFTCTNGHISWSASKEQYDMSCPECGEPTHLITSESADRVTPKVES
jgi:Zn finger protein HypA/HybF involved in hydrogenase expression